MRESGIGFHVPQAEPLVHAFRERYDPSCGYGVPAHITLVYPFVDPYAFDDELLAELEAFFAATPAFDFELKRVGRFPDTLYLAPEPADPFLALIDRLVERWPDHPPYGGAFDRVLPHLTVAHGTDGQVLDAIAMVLRQSLPIPCRATDAYLMEGVNVPDGWETHATFPLAGK